MYITTMTIGGGASLWSFKFIFFLHKIWFIIYIITKILPSISFFLFWIWGEPFPAQTFHVIILRRFAELVGSCVSEWLMKLRAGLWVLNVHEIFFGRSGPPVPGAAAVVPLHAGVELSLSALNRPLHNPVRPQALCGLADGAGDAGALDHLQTDKRKSCQTDRQTDR